MNYPEISKVSKPDRNLRKKKYLYFHRHYRRQLVQIVIQGFLLAVLHEDTTVKKCFINPNCLGI